jgi:Sulfotransferase family
MAVEGRCGVSGSNVARTLTGPTAVEPATRSGPIYIVGLDRSGKTTMAAFLTSHPAIAIPEVGSNLETYFLDRYGDLSEDSNLDRCLASMLRYTHVQYLEPDADEIRRRFVEGERTYARLFTLFLSGYAERRDKRRWGAQSGLVEAYAEHLFASYEGLRVIHMVRDPRDRYVASREAFPNGRGGVGGATARWNHSMRLAERNERRHAGAYTVVRFEDLVTRTEQTLRDVCWFVGEAYHPDMMRMTGTPERRRRLEARAGVGAGEPPLSSRFIGSFREAMSAQDIAFMQLHGRRHMRRRGYSLERIGLSATQWLRLLATTWPAELTRMLAWHGREAMHLRFPSRFGHSPSPRTLVDAEARVGGTS